MGHAGNSLSSVCCTVMNLFEWKFQQQQNCVQDKAGGKKQRPIPGVRELACMIHKGNCLGIDKQTPGFLTEDNLQQSTAGKMCQP